MILSYLLLELLNKEETFRSHPLATNQHDRHSAHKFAHDDADVGESKSVDGSILKYSR